VAKRLLALAGESGTRHEAEPSAMIYRNSIWSFGWRFIKASQLYDNLKLMSMRKQTWQALEDMFSEDPILKAEAVKPAEVTAAERNIGITLPEDYKEFIRRYGGAIVGPFPIYGLRRSEPMGDDSSSFLEVTKSFRLDHWSGTDKWVIISIDHAGNPVGLDADGKVWISDHDARAIQLLAPNFEAYLRKWCLKLPD
jgi:SMI1 / KNR4 family (SUKH-1)